MNLDLQAAQALDAARTGPESVDKYGKVMVGGRRALAPLIERYGEFPQAWSPTTKWEDAGPLIERFKPTMEFRDFAWHVEIVFYLYGEYRASVRASAPELRMAIAECLGKMHAAQT